MGCCRHIEVGDAPRAPERVNDRIHDRRTGADSACFAGSLNAERIVPARDVARLKLDGGHLVGPRYRIIHQARGHELAGISIIDCVFHKRLADALCRAAVNLPGEQQRVERSAEIVHDHIADNPAFSGARIDLDLCDMSAVGVRRLRWCERMGGGETTPSIWPLRKGSKRDQAICAANPHCPAGDLEVVRAYFERFGGQSLEVIGKLFSGASERGATARDRA
jgi:hypothetical protein